MIFDSQFSLGCDVVAQPGDPFCLPGALFNQDDIRDEPMLFNCSVPAARRLGGRITRAFLDALPNAYQDGVIDTRSHMLMRGWYPCIPGWHHDDVPRTRSDGQPDYSHKMPYRASHAMAIVGLPISRTRFAVGKIDMEIPPLGSTVYAVWHREVAALIRNGEVKSVPVPMNQVVYFDWQSFHRGEAATNDGWRWFGRVSIDTDRRKHVTNEIRKQVQVYMSASKAGW